MSKVRYKNSRTNRILVYESIPHYDPVTKQNRPTRTYLGYEDMDTHEFHPSSGKRGRPAKQPEQNSNPSDQHFETLYKSVVSTSKEQAHQITNLRIELEKLREENSQLRKKIREDEELFNEIQSILSKKRSND